MKKTEKILLLLMIIFLFTTLTLVINYRREIRAALNFPDGYIIIEDTDSGLLPLLADKEIFSDSFSWYSISVTQKYSRIVTTPDDYIELADIFFVGFINKHDNISVFELILKYNEPVLALEDIKMDDSIDDLEGNRIEVTGYPVNINFKEVSSLQKSRCLIYVGEIVNCVVEVGYSNLLIRFYVKTDYTVTENEIKNTVNLLLEDMAEKLPEY